MAHFARINNDSIVEQVIVVANPALLDDQGVEQEGLGIELCRQLYGEDTNWVQTSYNGTKRKNFAGIGYTYDSVRDAFIPPRPYPSWQLDEYTCLWSPPVDPPEDYVVYMWIEAEERVVPMGYKYLWDEELVDWVSNDFVDTPQH